jgi:hypothetical protein
MFTEIVMTLPSLWVSALINGDESGFDMDDPMDDHSDYKTSQKFCDHMDKTHFSWWAVDCQDEGFLKYHDAAKFGALAGDCHKVLIQIPTEE